MMEGNQHYAAESAQEDIYSDAWQEYNFEAEGSSGHSDKEQLVALLLAIFVGSFGAGRFYVEDYLMGSLKLVLGITVCICAPFLPSCLVRCMKTKKSKKRLWGCASCLYCLAFVALIAWLIADVVLFALNEVHDQQGMQLKPM